MNRNAYTVAAVNPFWRYAVAMDERPDLPAVPFSSMPPALAFFDESRTEFPHRTTVLLKRKWWRRVDVIASTAKDDR